MAILDFKAPLIHYLQILAYDVICNQHKTGKKFRYIYAFCTSKRSVFNQEKGL